MAAALESFDAERPSAASQDVNLPDGSGLDALLEYKKRQPQAIVIMITGNVQLEPLFLPRVPVIPVVLLLSPGLEFCYTLA